MEKLMHVMVSQPNQSRRSLLQSNIDIIRILKGYEKLKIIKKERLLYANYIKKEVKELNTLVENLYENLPHVRQERHIEQEKESKKKQKVKEKPRNTELDRLEQDIKKLQDKINSL